MESLRKISLIDRVDSCTEFIMLIAHTDLFESLQFQ